MNKDYNKTVLKNVKKKQKIPSFPIDFRFYIYFLIAIIAINLNY